MQALRKVILVRGVQPLLYHVLAIPSTCSHGPLSRYVKLRVAHAREYRERFPRHRLQRKLLVNDPSMLTTRPWHIHRNVLALNKRTNTLQTGIDPIRVGNISTGLLGKCESIIHFFYGAQLWWYEKTNNPFIVLLTVDYSVVLMHGREPDGKTSCYPIPQDDGANRTKVDQSIFSISKWFSCAFCVLC